MRVLVTGATGFLGGAVLARLRHEGVASIGLGRDAGRLEMLRAAGHEVLRHDIADGPPEVAGVTEVVHCAALSAPFGPAAAFERANVEGTRNMAEFAARAGVRRFVHISSPSIYFDWCDQEEVREDTPLPPPVNDYARTKAEAERIVLHRSEIHPIILRPRGIYGAGDTALLPRLLRVARRRRLPLFRNGAARIDLTHVDDVVEAIVTALAADRDCDGPTFNISGGEPLPVRRIAEQACARAGLTTRWRRMPLGLAMRAAGMAEAVARRLPGQPEPPVTRYGLSLFAYRQSLDLSRARDRLGWQPKVSFAEGLDRTFKGAA
ncbi:NAD-dependent epimerase/dehydratase family protein [Pelagovum pacificum]|uniref:NAD(P)-dependent oxidoreductase n=1 Tax=Pelagovum pacificum TaxID=2588711 RepID=A0A5C5GAZ5_9RHOB|nr:NAD(P)-dependent oxidoreductase [Pelagovum pacificum]QQA42092.1 NAD(P)-dependent oxidoreductase [Pelagovum pacificum]TNY31180.1 NAD(P)-dependent oxidoreductase [Pelagovum pacificum]